jgi:hypothetical protein
MHKPGIMLLIMGGFLAGGLVLSFYASQWTTENLSRGDDKIASGGSLEIITQLDPSTSETGIFAVNILDFKEDTISIKVFDPFDTQIIAQIIEMDRYQETFKIISTGSYKLVIENSGAEDFQVFGAIGHVPSDYITYLNYAGFYLLIAGLVGMGGIGIYAVKNKRRIKFS